MNKYIKIWAFLFILPVSLSAQITVDSVLAAIEKNNTTLSAMRNKAEAEKFKNQTGIYLQNPEVGFDYLWGNSSDIGNKIDFSIKQSFDFPTASGYRRQKGIPVTFRPVLCTSSNAKTFFMKRVFCVPG